MNLTHTKSYIILTLLSLLIWSAEVYAQFPSIRNFSACDYKGGTQNWDVAQSKGGYIFIANNLGLMVYNGTSWDMAYVPNHTNVHAVVADKSASRFYVGAFEEFGYFKNEDPLCKSEYVSLSAKLPKAHRLFKDVWGVVELPNQDIVFRTNHHIFIYNPTTDKIATLLLDSKISAVECVNGTAYVATESRIYILRGNKFYPIDKSESMAGKNVCGVLLDYSDNNAVFVTRNDGMFKYDGTTFTPHTFTGLSESLKGAKIFCVAQSRNLMAVGTISHGVYCIDRRNGRLTHLDRSNGLRNNTVLGMLIDSDDNLWTALDNGLSYIILDSPFSTLFTETDNIGTGYASAVARDRLYVGTNQGLYHIPVPGDYSVHAFTPTTVNGITGQIWTLNDCGGETLLCGADAGAYNVAGDMATPITGMGPTWGFRCIPGHPNLAMAAMYDGFAILSCQSGTWRLLHHIKGTTEATVNFEVDFDGSIWYSHWLQGVYHILLSDDMTEMAGIEYYNASNQLPSDDNNLVALIDGRVYISATDGFYIANAAGKLSKVKWLDSLFPPSGVSTRLFQTPDGDLWGYRPGFLAFAKRKKNAAPVSPDTFTLRRFHYAASVGRLQMNLGNLSYLPGGLTVMNQEEGFYVVDPSVYAHTQRKVWIDFVTTLATENENKYDRPFLFQSGYSNNMFEVAHRDASLYFEFSIPQYREESGALFSTFVDGYEKEWTAYSTINHRELTNVPPGKYIFRVRAKDNITGSISESAVEFTVKPEWYETWWARTLGVMILITLLYLAVDSVKKTVMSRIERQRIREEQHRIEAEQQLRLQQERERLEREQASMRENNERLSREIKQKSSELAGADLNSQKRADTLREVGNALSDIITECKESHSADDVLKRVRRVRQSLLIHGAEESSWERMQENFNIIFDDLLQKLVSEYPSLTRNDIKLCSYLKLNMSSKEIASLMNLSERSVESNRYRLRKKLNMAPGQSFSEFFTSIG